MARIRYIKPDFFEDTAIAELKVEARLLYIGLWTLMDKRGLAEYDPRLIKKHIFGYDDKIGVARTAALIADLVEGGFLRKLEHEGKEYLFCPTFSKHQNFHRDEKPKYLIPEAVLHDAELAPCSHGATTMPKSIDASASTTGTGTENRNGNRNGELGDRSTVPAPALPPAIASQESRFSSKARELLQTVKEESLVAWWQSYPDGEFFILEANKAANWILSNKHKAPKKFDAFFSRWLGKAWEEYRKRLPTTPGSSAAPINYDKVFGRKDAV